MTETPKYSVVKKEKQIELRQYVGYIQAEVDIVDKYYQTAVRRGFNILVGYIFGNNISRQKIEMTAPVQASQFHKIAMTTTVTVKGDTNFAVAFIMLSEYTLETLPIPKDNRIRFTLIPAHPKAKIRFSGYFRQENIRKTRSTSVPGWRKRDWKQRTILLLPVITRPGSRGLWREMKS